MIIISDSLIEIGAFQMHSYSYRTVDLSSFFEKAMQLNNSKWFENVCVRRWPQNRDPYVFKD